MKHLNIYVIFDILLYFTFNQSAIAQEDVLKSEYSYKRYTTADGLPDLITTSVFQDSKGFIWVGSLQGFARFDGKQLKAFNSKGMSIISFTEFNHNVIAMGLFTSFRVKGNDSVNTIKMLSKTTDVNCWENSKSLPEGYAVYLINEEPGIYSITDTGLVKIWHHDLIDQISEGNNIYWDKRNKHFFIPTVEHGLYVVHENGNVEKHFDVNGITCFIPYENSIWAVGYKGLYEYKDDKLKLIFDYPFFDSVNPNIQLVEDSEHNLLIRTSSCLYRYSKGQLEIITDKLMSSRDLFVDNEGNIWVAAANGLFNFYKLSFKNYTLLPEGSLSQSIVIDKQNRVWLPAYDGRIIRMKNKKTEIVKCPASPGGYSSFGCGCVVNNNFLYLPGGSCILKYDCDKNTFQWLPGIPPSSFEYISILPNGNIFAGNTTDAIEYDLLKGIKRTFEMKQLKQIILTSLVDKQGNLLLGGFDGITVINGDSIRYLNSNALKLCVNMSYDKDGKLWLICGNRLVSMENDSAKVEHVFQKNLCNLHFTRSGIMIVTTEDELYLAPDTKHLDFIRYDQNNGYNNAFGIRSTDVAEDMDGNIFIPTIEKIVSFNPDNLLGKMQPPKLYEQNFMTSVDNIQWEPSDSDRQQLDHRHNNIRFNYIGLSYTSAQNVRYHYRLLGFQDDWSDPAKDREVTFNNLPPGDYTFEIYADSGTDESRSETQSFAFSIQPAFWQTAWFLVASIASLMLASAGVALYVQRRKNKALLEKLRAEKELNELRISSIRLKAIPHFNANVLAAIEYYIANRTREEAMRILGIYSDFTFKTLSDVDKAARPLSEELTYVKMYLDLEKIRFLDKFDFKINVDKNVDEDVQLPNMILHTYCENAVKHGLMPLKTGGILSINVSQRDRIVFVSVEDNGVGRDNAGKNPYIHSTKQGLSILNRQIEIYNSFNREKINSQVDDLFESGKPSGTRFMVEVPVDFEYVN